MKRFLSLLIVSSALLSGCGNFRKLSADLKIIDNEYRVSGIIENRDAYKVPVRAAVVEWDRSTGQVYSGDRLDLTTGGAFSFSVKSPLNQHVAAYADENRNGRPDNGEPTWIHTGPDGKPAPVTIDPAKRRVLLKGNLSKATRLPPALLEAVRRKLDGRTAEEVMTRRGARIALGEIGDPADPRFAATRGEEGLWTPATMAIQHGAGLYFLAPYDPTRIPVLFVHGAGGSPQDWRLAMEKIDRSRYQPWFFFYPSGARLDNIAQVLNEGVERLHSRYRFQRLHVVAHSMGGLVSRRFIQKNVIEDKNSYIDTFITFSSPWDGHEAAALGVKWAPSVIPSWRDMEHGSSFLAHLYDERLKGRVNHHLFYSHRGKRSPVMPAENDGSVSVASQLRPEAVADAVSVQGYNEDHMSILVARDALKRAEGILDKAGR